MPVYVDQLRRIVARGSVARRVGARTGHLWCHMVADTKNELHEMAIRIGMRREWFQPESFPHYDLIPSRRAAAVALGAVEVDRRKLVRVMRRFRGE